MRESMQQYCLRWNNHRSNLLLVFEHLFQTEAFTDVTLACDGSSIKCHKMVLAACSSYFQALFMENDCRHPIVILKDIRFSEIKAILEYMYKGEVNVAQDQLAGLLKAAETLKVKGLVEENNASVSGTPTPPQASPYPPPPEFHPGPKANSKQFEGEGLYDLLPERPALPFPLWNSGGGKMVPSSPKHNSYDNSQNEPVPLKKKRYLSTASKDTPILRTVLGHTGGQTNSDPPQQKSINYALPGNLSNGPTEMSEKEQQGLSDSPDHFMEESVRSVESDKVHEDNHSFNMEGDDKHGIATYVPTQKPEWKRYKQYTRNDIMAAIDAVRAGMSALQAARKYGVPSRTLYDKVKKLGITTNRPYRKGTFPMSPYQGQMIKMEDISDFSPEHPTETPGNNGNRDHGGEGDSDKMDSDNGGAKSTPPPHDIIKEENHHVEEESQQTQQQQQENGAALPILV